MSRRSPPRVQPKPASRYHHGTLQRALIEAALVLVEEKGPEALTLRAVARLAGVSANAPYNHFQDKAALLAAAAEDSVERLFLAMSDARDGSTTAAERLEAIGIAYVSFAAAQPSRFRLLSVPGIGQKTAHPGLTAAYGRAFGVLEEAIAACQAEHVVREGDVRRLALTAWATVHGLATLLVEDQLAAAGFDPGGTYATTVVRTLFRGLRAEPTTPSDGDT